jgi:hypothetical protein
MAAPIIIKRINRTIIKANPDPFPYPLTVSPIIYTSYLTGGTAKEEGSAPPVIKIAYSYFKKV